MNLLFTLADWIWPPKCIGCNALLSLGESKNKYFCETCNALFEPVSGSLCLICGKPFSDALVCVECSRVDFAFSKHKAVFLYDGITRQILFDIKFKNKRRSADGLAVKLEEYAPRLEYDLVTAVPMNARKEFARGFNQSVILAKRFATARKLKYEDLLSRKKYTLPQMGLSPIERQNNIRGAFVLLKNANIKKLKILIIDDIYTTGITLNECARILKSEGAALVDGLSLSITKSNAQN